MMKLLAIAFGLSLLGATLSTAQAQATGGSTDRRSHVTKNAHKLEQHRSHRGGKKHHAGKKGNSHMPGPRPPG